MTMISGILGMLQGLNINESMLSHATQVNRSTKFQQALVRTRVEGVYRVHWRALCRDKYAPWGRGALGGRPVEQYKASIRK